MNFDDFRGHVYLIDDDPSICRSLAFTLSSSNYSVQTFDSPQAFLKDSLPISPAVILLDMRMPGMTGTELQNTLLQSGRETPIIFISGESQPSEIINAMKHGAIDFLLKPFSMESLMTAIENGLNKDRARQQQLVRVMDIRQRFSRLTEKEQEICRWMIKGYGNKEIAELNGSAPSTVKLHRSRVLDKMGCETLPELIELSIDDKRRIFEVFG
ncbi:response regulator transcription factor [Limnohabitans lacus]|jgi:two-component system, LuxR family, response regulator FixJ|uniref:Response regulator n=1 Tax=Limnohabitans lacus TaxID=3045173 RepID=A0ABT6X5N1_9BURK|nr:response regulator [Limnohabitans sp. HM2-2]MDI9233423.1 response regulator [Limnohabitans sp. HM2-2]